MNFIVIGATQGLGYELVKLMYENGHNVAAGTVEAEPPPVLKALKGTGRLHIFPADVTQDEHLITGAASCEKFFGGKADALCNVAGVLLPGDRVNLIHECDPAELRHTFAVNTIGLILVGKFFYPVIKKGGKLLSVTSESSGLSRCGTWVPCYGLSKTSATKASGVFNASIEDVDFYSVHPGRMNTEMGRTTAQIEPLEAAQGIYKQMTGECPLSRDVWYVDYNGNPMNTD
jgi:NAD(P)-dependent dehydrogenase (short-subunit alcohol dehydrogenase family)